MSWKQFYEVVLDNEFFNINVVDEVGYFFVIQLCGEVGMYVLVWYDFECNVLVEKLIIVMFGFDFIGGFIIEGGGEVFGVCFYVDVEVIFWFDLMLKVLQDKVDEFLFGWVNCIIC